MSDVFFQRGQKVECSEILAWSWKELSFLGLLYGMLEILLECGLSIFALTRGCRPGAEGGLEAGK